MEELKMVIYTLRHWNNGEIECIYQGYITWVNEDMGEFVFKNISGCFWGKTDYWEVIEHDYLKPIGIVKIK